MTHPAVTVLIPAYNAASFIGPMLQSVSAQSSAEFRTVISVDVSTDSTFDICVAHAARDARFSVVRQEQRQGYVGNCNFLLGQANTDCAMFAFHDDILAPHCVERLSAALAAAPHAVLAYCDMEMTEIGGMAQHWAFTALAGQEGAVARGLAMLRQPEGWWVPNRGLFRMAAARRVKGVKRHSAGEFVCDLPWLLHLSLLGDFVRVPETLCFKFLQTHSLSRTWDYTDAQWLAVHAACLREIWESDLGEGDKLALSEALLVQSRPRHGRFHWLPRPLRDAAKAVLPKPVLRWLS